MFLNFLFLAAGWQLKSYSGGSSPLLIILAMLLFFALILASFIFAIIEAVKRLRFKTMCSRAGLTGEEVGQMRSFAKKFHIANPVRIVESRRALDLFFNRVATQFTHTDAAKVDEAIALFTSVRKKLNLNHNVKAAPLHSSRGLLVGFPIQVVWIDTKAKQSVLFDSKVRAKNDFFLGIAAPQDPDLALSLSSESRPTLEVSFFRMNDAEYLFESSIARIDDRHTPPVWYIQHSPELLRLPAQEDLGLSGKILYTNIQKDEAIEEYAISISSINSKTCMFAPTATSVALQTDSYLIMTFALNQKKLSCRGQIRRITGQVGTPECRYHLEFTQLEKDTEAAIIRFVLDLRGEQIQRVKGQPV